MKIDNKVLLDNKNPKPDRDQTKDFLVKMPADLSVYLKYNISLYFNIIISIFYSFIDSFLNILYEIKFNYGMSFFLVPNINVKSVRIELFNLLIGLLPNHWINHRLVKGKFVICDINIINLLRCIYLVWVMMIPITVPE